MVTNFHKNQLHWQQAHLPKPFNTIPQQWHACRKHNHTKRTNKCPAVTATNINLGPFPIHICHPHGIHIGRILTKIFWFCAVDRPFWRFPWVRRAVEAAHGVRAPPVLYRWIQRFGGMCKYREIKLFMNAWRFRGGHDYFHIYCFRTNSSNSTAILCVFFYFIFFKNHI